MVPLVSLWHLWTSTVTEALPCCSLNHISFFSQPHAATHQTRCCFLKCILTISVRSPLPCWLTLGVGAVLPGAGRCGAQQQQQPGDRTGANRSGGEHHRERGGAHRSGAAPEQECSGTDHSRAAHRQDRSGAHRSGVKQRSQKREQRLCQRKLQPTRMQKSIRPCAAEQCLDRRGTEHKPAALKRGGSACAAGNRSTCVQASPHSFRGRFYGKASPPGVQNSIWGSARQLEHGKTTAPPTHTGGGGEQGAENGRGHKTGTQQSGAARNAQTTMERCTQTFLTHQLVSQTLAD